MHCCRVIILVLARLSCYIQLQGLQSKTAVVASTAFVCLSVHVH